MKQELELETPGKIIEELWINGGDISYDTQRDRNKAPVPNTDKINTVNSSVDCSKRPN